MIFNKFLTIFLVLYSTVLFSSDNKFKNSDFAKIPILEGGRIKPLDTFARSQLLMIYEKSKLEDMSAIEWLQELLFKPEIAFKRNIFRIRNKEVINTLGLKFNPKHLYSFIDVSISIKKEEKLIHEINKINQKERTPSQQQIFELYFKVRNILDISRSLSLLLPQFVIENAEHAKRLRLEPNQAFSYLEILKSKPLYQELANSIFEKKHDAHTIDESDILSLGRKLETISMDNDTTLLRIIPPPFQKNLDTKWTSPWQTIQQGLGTPLSVKYFKLWGQLYLAYKNNDIGQWMNISAKAFNYSTELGKDLINQQKIIWEVRYNNIDFFTKSVVFYIFAFLLLSLSWIVGAKYLQKASLVSVGIGAVLHTIGLTIRCFIMGRPPVSTLYESIIFVSIVCVISALFMEYRLKNTLGTFIASCLGSILLFVSFSYEKDGDTMGMLSAVLDTNFWLATHVVTITIGYGCCFVASILGHVYLFKEVNLSISDSGPDKKTIQKNMHGACLYSLFFTVLGTILGGIWADQSWGRFWGWDPKENGAMLICMWMLWAVHGRLTKYFNDLTYALVVSLTSIVVVLAWFGVNLLNVGLHSYGFTSNIATNIALFSFFEIFVCFGAFIYIKKRAVL